MYDVTFEKDKMVPTWVEVGPKQ
jgi:hypothetical protein